MAEDTINNLCMVCGEPSYLTEPVDACPHCGDIGTPADLDQIVTVTLTKHELRILTFWAEAYARIYSRMGYDPSDRMSLTLKTIFDRLCMQTDTPLSIMQEMADLRSSVDQKYGSGLSLVLFDTNGRCMECNEQLDTYNEESMFGHQCGGLGEPSTADEDDTPPLSS